MSSKTPLLSVVKRVRKLLELADHRALGKISLEQKNSEHAMLNALAEEKERKRRHEGEEIMLRATGKAIEKLLGIALFFSGQEDVKIGLKTGTVSVVDDIVEKDENAEQDVKGDIPETQIRRTSMLEVGVRSK